MKKLLISLLPGIFLIGYNIGTGSVSSMAKAGANYGLQLLWAILISCVGKTLCLGLGLDFPAESLRCRVA